MADYELCYRQRLTLAYDSRLRDHQSPLIATTYWWRTLSFGGIETFTYRIPQGIIIPSKYRRMTNVITCQSSQCLNGNPPSRLECPTCNK